MNSSSKNVSALKDNIVREMFVRTADENYITARWCAANDLHIDFLWLSVHALEKYLKAVLLTNEQSSKTNAHSSTRFYGHDIGLLYAAVKALAGPLLPARVRFPDALDIPHWRDKTPEDFLSHLWQNGNADNRYLIYGYNTSSADLDLLDSMVFVVRRLICRLDADIEYINGPAVPTETYRARLIRWPTWYHSLNMPLDKLIASKVESPLRHAALNCNRSFAPVGYPDTPVQSGISGRTPVLLLRVLDPLASHDRSYAAEGIEIAEWLLANVHIPAGKGSGDNVKKEIEDAIQSARLRHNLP